MLVRFRMSSCLLSLAALAALVAGCDSSALSAPKVYILCSFENLPDPDQGKVLVIPDTLKKPGIPYDDYGWSTGGYVSLAPMKKFATQGKYSAEARFTVPTDFKSLSEAAGMSNWEAGMSLSTETPTRLSLTDWSGYDTLKVDIYNDSDHQYEAALRVVDSHSNLTETAGVINPKSKNTLAMAVTQLSEARLSMNDIKMVTLYMDTVHLRTDPVLYIDNLRLERGNTKR